MKYINFKLIFSSFLLLQEESDTKLAVQESLAMMSEAFKSLDGPNLKLMEALIMQNIEKVHTYILNE